MGGRWAGASGKIPCEPKSAEIEIPRQPVGNRPRERGLCGNTISSQKKDTRVKPTVFIHTNHKQITGAIVSAHSLKRGSATPDEFDVKILDIREHSYFSEFNGKLYLRGGIMRPWLFEDLQSFTPSRFMPPELMNYEGRAIVVDPDIFAVSDIMDLFRFDMEGKAVRLVLKKRRKEPGFDKMTSVMLMDCAKLKHWKVEESFRSMFKSELDYVDWLQMKREDQDTIGTLPPEWNHFDILTPETRMLHTTRRMTQPWKSGLPIDFNTELDSKLKRGFANIQRKLFGTELICRRYKTNPDPRQEQLFFALLKECLEEGKITEELIREEMKKNHVRHDALKIIANVKPLPPRERMSEFLGEKKELQPQ